MLTTAIALRSLVVIAFAASFWILVCHWIFRPRRRLQDRVKHQWFLFLAWLNFPVGRHLELGCGGFRSSSRRSVVYSCSSIAWMRFHHDHCILYQRRRGSVAFVWSQIWTSESSFPWNRFRRIKCSLGGCCLVCMCTQGLVLCRSPLSWRFVLASFPLFWIWFVDLRFLAHQESASVCCRYLRIVSCRPVSSSWTHCLWSPSSSHLDPPRSAVDSSLTAGCYMPSCTSKGRKPAARILLSYISASEWGWPP